MSDAKLQAMHLTRTLTPTLTLTLTLTKLQAMHLRAKAAGVHAP